MNSPVRSDPRTPLRSTALAIALAVLGGCAMISAAPLYRVPPRPAYFRALTAPAAAIDPAAAADLLTGYRAANNLGPVAPDPALTAIARRAAMAEAAQGAVGHDLAGPLDTRARASGYDYAVIEENVAGGYGTLAAAFDGWQRSAEHRRNMLDPHVTRVGVAVAQATGRRYRVYWSLVLAAPGRPAPTLAAGPTVVRR
jgi:uncharacterized protein YkwD